MTIFTGVESLYWQFKQLMNPGWVVLDQSQGPLFEAFKIDNTKQVWIFESHMHPSRRKLNIFDFQILINFNKFGKSTSQLVRFAFSLINN